MHGILSCLHEFGHGIYERQVDPAIHAHAARAGRVVGVPRVAEPHVGKPGRPEHRDVAVLLSQVQRTSPIIRRRIARGFHRAVNKVQPSLIRVDADEITYGLHIILRFELERAMLSGRARAEGIARGSTRRCAVPRARLRPTS